jgi:NADP-reducing hydrogenase subunit HndB
MGTCGIAAGARSIMNVVMEELTKSNLKDVAITTSGCAGLCSKEPMATIELSGEPPVKYIALTDEKMRKIFAEHVVGGKPVQDFALVVGHETTY